MQHDYWDGGDCKDRICASLLLYVPLPLIFNLICNMTTFSEKIVLTFDPILGDEGVYKESIYACMALYVLLPLI